MTATCSTPKPFEKTRTDNKKQGTKIAKSLQCLSTSVVGTVKANHTAHGPGASYGLKRDRWPQQCTNYSEQRNSIRTELDKALNALSKIGSATAPLPGRPAEQRLRYKIRHLAEGQVSEKTKTKRTFFHASENMQFHPK